MSLMKQVEALVAIHGPCTVDGIMPYMGTEDRRKVQRAMNNLHLDHRLVITERGKRLGQGKGTTPAAYEVAPPREKRVRAAKVEVDERPASRQVASVWDWHRACA